MCDLKSKWRHFTPTSSNISELDPKQPVPEEKTVNLLAALRVPR